MITRGVSCTCRRCKTAWTALTVEAIVPCPYCDASETEILEVHQAPKSTSRCKNARCVDGRVVELLEGNVGTITRVCPDCLGFGAGRGGPRAVDSTIEQLELLQRYRANPPRRARRTRTRRKSNSPRGVPVRTFDRRTGHLVSKQVLELAYFNIGSAARDPYVHEFESAGVEMWALVDGTLLLRHPQHRLWEDFVVPDGE